MSFFDILKKKKAPVKPETDIEYLLPELTPLTLPNSLDIRQRRFEETMRKKYSAPKSKEGLML